MTMQEQVKAYQDDLAIFATPDEKLEYILDFGKNPPTLPEKDKTEANRIKGCASRAWLTKELKEGKVVLGAEGDSIIAKGMLVVLLGIFNHRTPEAILTFDPAILQHMGLMELLSPVRQKSLEAFLSEIYGFAQSCREVAA